jgi:hypothetical protein
VKRYFIVRYVGSPLGYGDSTYITDGKFLNRKKTMDDILKRHPLYKEIIILNIQELTEQDFSDWTETN